MITNTDLIKEIEEYKSNGQYIIWYYDKIEVGELINLNLKENQIDNIYKARFFNTDSEFYVWRSNETLNCRHRTDDTLQTDQVVNAELPIRQLGLNVDTYKTICIRNYIGYIDNQARYEDFRFVSFK